MLTGQFDREQLAPFQNGVQKQTDRCNVCRGAATGVLQRNFITERVYLLEEFANRVLDLGLTRIKLGELLNFCPFRYVPSSVFVFFD